MEIFYTRKIIITPPSKNLKINGRIIGDSDILFCQGKCQKWNIQSLNLSKKVVVTGTVRNL